MTTYSDKPVLSPRVVRSLEETNKVRNELRAQMQKSLDRMRRSPAAPVKNHKQGTV